MALILTEKKDSTGIITLNHAEKRNALSEALIMEITAALDGFRALDIRAVVLRAQPGIKVWSAGHDVSELPEGRRDPLGWDDPLRKELRRKTRLRPVVRPDTPQASLFEKIPQGHVSPLEVNNVLGTVSAEG